MLYPIEAAEIGDVSGLKVLHLQCHIGLDTLCLARRGARVTGLDFSAAALRHARAIRRRRRHRGALRAWRGLRRRRALRHRFRPRLYHLGNDQLAARHPPLGRGGRRIAEAGRRASISPTSIPRSPRSTRSMAGRFRPSTGERRHRCRSNSRRARPIPATRARSQHMQNFNWIHPLSDILMALIDHGLAIEHIAEHEALPWAMFPLMQPGPTVSIGCRPACRGCRSRSRCGPASRLEPS